MSSLDRQHAITKITRYVSGRKTHPELAAAVERYTSRLTDDRLTGLVRVTGTAARNVDAVYVIRDLIKDDRYGILAHLIDNPEMEFTAGEYDHAATMFAIMRSYGHPTMNNTVHWKAHFRALTTYDTIDMSDFWIYSRNKALMDLVDAHPEDVDGIVRLRNDFKHRVVTEEILAEYKATHRALNAGLI